MQVQVGDDSKRTVARSTWLRIGIGLIIVVACALGIARLRGWRYKPLDGITANAMLAAFGEDTEYATRYSERAFSSLRGGMTDSDLIQALGEPLERAWWYPTVTTGPRRCCTVVLDGRGQRVVENVQRIPTGGRFEDLPRGTDAATVVRLHGSPAEETWTYAGRNWKSEEHDLNYRIRYVILRDGLVVRTAHEVYID